MSSIDEDSEAFGVDLNEVAGADLIDVRRVPAFAAANHLLPGAYWRDPERVDEWSSGLKAGRRIVVYCVHGHEVSRRTALRLRAVGLDACFLRGGFEAWQTAGLPLVPKGEHT